MRIAAIVAMALVAGADFADAAVVGRCSLSDYRADVYLDDVRCSEAWDTDAKGNQYAIIKIGTRVFRINLAARQGQWASITINGVRGARYETNRYEYHYTALDMSLAIDVYYPTR